MFVSSVIQLPNKEGLSVEHQSPAFEPVQGECLYGEVQLNKIEHSNGGGSRTGGGPYR